MGFNACKEIQEQLYDLYTFHDEVSYENVVQQLNDLKNVLQVPSTVFWKDTRKGATLEKHFQPTKLLDLSRNGLQIE